MLLAHALNVLDRCMEIKERGGTVISVDYVLEELLKDAQTHIMAPLSDSRVEVGQTHGQQ